MKITILYLSLISHLILGVSCSSKSNDLNSETNENNQEEPSITYNFTKTIPIGSNSWVLDNMTQDRAMIASGGIHNWTNLSTNIRTYFRTSSTGELQLGLTIKAPDGQSKIKVTLDGVSKEVTLTNTDYSNEEVGVFTINEVGYHFIEIQGVEKNGTYIADVTALLLGGVAANNVNFVPTDNHYFGRRGPSVHMGYLGAQNTEVKWFYNEVTVPEGNDIIGSFFMANGHGQGYFGMQVNSATERRILFSIWSGYQTDDPNQIPEDYKVIDLGHGSGVIVQDFGNEGSGKQSIKKFNWQAGKTYKFLLKGEPSENNSTDYTAYFYEPDEGQWQLIAKLRRPKISTYLTGMHSFLENFEPSTGYIPREVIYKNQWIYTSSGQWQELTKGRFTRDATAANGDRFDFKGGVNGNSFFLKNCGFFNANVAHGTEFTRTAEGDDPQIDFEALPTP